MTCPRPWQIGPRFGNWGTQVMDAHGDLVCIVVTHERVKADNTPAAWVATAEGAATLAAVVEAGSA